MLGPSGEGGEDRVEALADELAVGLVVLADVGERAAVAAQREPGAEGVGDVERARGTRPPGRG